MKVLCVVAHADDEVLGCGGTLAKHAEAGDKIRVLCLSHDGRVREFVAAAKILGAIPNVGDYHGCDQRFDMFPLQRIVTDIEDWDFQPDVIYTHNPDDLNLDHQIVARAVLTAFRAPRFQADILAFDTLSSTEFGPTVFQPNHWETLTEAQVEKKAKALECYPTEIREFPHPRNTTGIWTEASYRGRQVCQPLAEAFRILRSIR